MLIRIKASITLNLYVNRYTMTEHDENILRSAMTYDPDKVVEFLKSTDWSEISIEFDLIFKI